MVGPTRWRTRARQVLARIDAIQAEAGTDKSRILTATVWLPAIADLAAFNTVRDAWVPADEAPARAGLEICLADPAIKVKIGCIAALPRRLRAGRPKTAPASGSGDDHALPHTGRGRRCCALPLIWRHMVRPWERPCT
ncbi:Rid family hydrolase [Xanthobacter sp. NFH-44]|uniref:Rid family hydrolase n=1 Tax=unclassified Xanthobacter TaxID=2623496 RepID=UPI00351D91A4